MLHALALSAALLMLFLALRQMVRDVARYIYQAPKAAPQETQLLVVRFVPAPPPLTAARLAVPLETRPVPLAA